MKTEKLKKSGQLELYVLEDLSLKEKEEVEAELVASSMLLRELFEIERALEVYAQVNGVTVNPFAKPFLIAKISYLDRLERGLEKGVPPSLSKQSEIIDYQPWLDDMDFQEPIGNNDFSGHVLHASEGRTQFVIWLNGGIPPEIHTQEVERFLIVEGACDITIGQKIHSLKAGDFIEIPLHIEHHINVTSAIKCQIILELSAA